MKKIAVLFNPSSGRGKSIKEKKKIERYFTANGLDIDLSVSQSEDHLRELAEESVLKYPVIVGVGGDTTFNIIAAEILHTCPAPVLGMIGTGSANDVVRGLGIHNIDHACNAIKKGRVREMDVGTLKIKRDRGKDELIFFLGTLSAGLGTTVNRYVEQFHQRRKLLARLNPFTQVSAGLLGIRRSFSSGALPLNTRIHCTPPGSSEPVEAEISFSLLVFLNTPYYANGLKLVEGEHETRLFDGLLDCCIVHTTSFTNTLGMGLKVRKGKHANREEVTLLKAPLFTVTPAAPMDLQVDGEIIEQVREFEVSVVPGWLKVLC
jgi:diacylglycerol kinase (ATP)